MVTKDELKRIILECVAESNSEVYKETIVTHEPNQPNFDIEALANYNEVSEEEDKKSFIITIKRFIANSMLKFSNVLDIIIKGLDKW